MALANDNLSAVLHGINDLRLEQRPIPQPNDEEVLIRMEVIGICGSDVHLLLDARIGSIYVEKPMVIGHEGAGTVLKIGKNVKQLKPGDRVAIDPGISCGKCSYCRKGRNNLCISATYCGAPPTDGNLTRYCVHPADLCFKLAEEIPLVAGALLQPLSIGVHACKRANVCFGSIVLVIGAGPIGLVTLMSSKALGASKIIVTDLVQYKLDKARKIGADYTILVHPSDAENVIAQKIIDALGCRPNISIDCAGAESSACVALQVTQTGGTVVLVGFSTPSFNVPVSEILLRELDVRGIFHSANDYPTALEMVASGKVDLKVLITHNFKLEEILEAFRVAKTGEGNAIKVLIHV